MKSQEFLENTFLFQNLFGLKPEIKTEMQPERKKMDKVAELERRLYLFHQCVEILKAENKKLKDESIVLSSSS